MTLPAAIDIIPLRGRAPARAELERLARGLREALGRPVRIGGRLDLGGITAAGDATISSNAIVDALAARFPDPERWFIAVTDATLSAPGRPFVFGEAALGGRWAVVSNAFLDSPGTPHDLAAERLLKEAIHELGHLAGLEHCDQTGCVMLLSVDTAGVDEKSTDFCDRCAERLDRSGRT